MRLHQITIVVLLCLVTSHVIPQVAGQEKRPARKLYTGKQLTEAKNAFKDYTFRDEKVGKLFSLDNKKAAGILLEIKKAQNDPVEIKIFANSTGEKRLEPVKTLTRKDADFEEMVTKLKLKE